METTKPASVASDDESSSGGDCGGGRILPEIDVTRNDRSIIIKMHCEFRKSVLVKALAEIENLGLRVVGANAMRFPDSFIHITVTALMEEGFSMTVDNLLNELRSAFEKFM